MSFQTPITIAEALDNIEHQKYLLPAIQREFEWSDEKIEWLFDSLMRGYPISSFLFWNVEDLSKSGYKFYKFLRVYRERYLTHNEDASVAGIGNFTAVLDGQQRLTSLYVGLKGSYAYKEYKRAWKNDEWSIPTRHLYLNISSTLKDQEDGRIYDFSFLKDSETKLADLHGGKWFRVGKILELQNFSTFSKYVSGLGVDDTGSDMLARLQEVVFTEKSINYFLEKAQDLDKALNIFIRINSGGKPLEFSDLIMSIAIANWEKKDARKEIHALVDRVQESGFSISKDFIFKTYLYLYSADIRFKVTNFTKDNAQSFEKDWEKIRDAIDRTFELISSFGYTDFTLASKNAVIPIIYYLYHRGIYQNFEAAIKHKEDRDVIRKWLHVMTLKRVFGAKSDATLSLIRRAFTEDVTSDAKIRAEIEEFPVALINSRVKSDVSVGEDFIDDLLNTQKDDRYAFCILALLSPHLDYKNNAFHKDHLHPISAFEPKAIRKMKLSKEQEEIFLDPYWNNSICNLQMLDPNANMAKQHRSLKEWVEFETKNQGRAQLLDRCLIPPHVDLDFANFPEFAEKRNDLLKKKLFAILK